MFLICPFTLSNYRYAVDIVLSNVFGSFINGLISNLELVCAIATHEFQLYMFYLIPYKIVECWKFLEIHFHFLLVTDSWECLFFSLRSYRNERICH